MSYLKIVRQISSLVTPDRYLAQPSASVKKEEVSMSYVHNLNSDERHAGSIKHRAKLVPRRKAPVHVGPKAREFSGAEQLQLASSLAGGMLSRPPAGPQLGWGALPGASARPGAWYLGERGCASRNALWDWEDGQTVLGLPGIPAQFWDI